MPTPVAHADGQTTRYKLPGGFFMTYGVKKMREFKAEIQLNNGFSGCISIVRNRMTIGNRQGLFEIAYITPEGCIVDATIMGALTASEVINWVKRYKNDRDLLLRLVAIDLAEANRARRFMFALDAQLGKEVCK